MIWWLIFVPLAGLIAYVLFEIVTAPLGYQDDDGWHAGEPDDEGDA